ncbi:hypothetical protein V6N12_030980 [Hibiscus sabdariffa]|uniref:Reverse transcriptase domain-containing protein n=1 Tax=Hibiscus sabdariffa TaxID=183260 RepID=A0ABR2E7L1_9ROSI
MRFGALLIVVCEFPFVCADVVSLYHTFFFADDLILYSRADLDQARIISTILTEFGVYYGHKVNPRKSHIFFSPNTDASIAEAICSNYGYCQTLSLGTCLGVLVDGTWDIGYLHDILLLGAIDHVVGVLPPSTDETQDMLAWRSTQDGNFTMASAYELMNDFIVVSPLTSLAPTVVVRVRPFSMCFVIVPQFVVCGRVLFL